IRNIGRDTIRQFYAGFFADNDVGTRGYSTSEYDDVTGFMEFNAAGVRVNTAWSAEYDGDEGHTPGCVGVRILRPTEREGRLSYNWWMSDVDVSSSDDWGPRTLARNPGDNPVVDPKDPYGSPEQDEDKYVLLCNGSIDPPKYNYETGEYSPDIPAGTTPNDLCRFMISFGPFGTDTGELFATPRGTEPLTLFYPCDSVLFSYAIIGGEGDPAVSAGLGATDPQAFVDLGNNANTAYQMFNGIFNTIDYSEDHWWEFIYYPEPPPPPSPPLEVIPGDNSVILDWSAADPSIPGYGTHGIPLEELPLHFKDPYIPDYPETDENESLAFEGFKVMRSPVSDPDNFIVLAVFDRAGNGIGRDTGLRFTYTDYVANGATFYYDVVSYDRGFPAIGLEPRTSSPRSIEPVTAGGAPNDEMNQKVWVEPNPYIEHSGYEPLLLRTAEYIENNRELQFVNLPESCTIRIFTLDLDLVQTIHHDDGTSRHRWNMLTRADMPIMSGIYIFTVDDGKGNRNVGKFVVIK
ncbi:hypothetical protein ACFL6I_12570, partial [candidate division KSB1 bacterium]